MSSTLSVGGCTQLVGIFHDPEFPCVSQRPHRACAGGSAEALQRAVTERYGLRLRQSWAEELPRALRRLQAARNLSSAALELAATNAQLLRELAGQLTVEETFFFRNAEQIQHAADHIRSVASSRGTRPVRVWSAGCSSGEEPYSLVMAVAERLGPQAAQVETIACDLNHAALERARAAVYGEWAFRGVDPSVIQRHFVPAGHGRQAVRPEYRGRVAFEHLAIQEMAHRIQPESMDVIFFRNVGVYLEPAAIEECVSAFARALRSDGILVQAPTDPQPPRTLFTRRSPSVASEYRLRDKTMPPPPKLPDPTYPNARTLGSITGHGSADAAQTALRQMVRWASTVAVRSASLPPRPAKSQGSRAPPTQREQVVSLGDGGRVSDALALVESVIDRQPHASDAYLLRAQLRLAASEPDLALGDLRRLLFVDKGHRLARYWYAVVLARLGRVPQALGQLEELERQLAATAPNAVIEDGQTKTTELLRATAWMRASLE